MFFTYVIENFETGKIYIGQTIDLQSRLDRHNQKLLSKQSSFTIKNATPNGWMFIYVEAYINRKDASIREKQLKTANGREFIKQFRKGQ